MIIREATPDRTRLTVLLTVYRKYRMNRTIFILLTILFLLTGCAPSEENTKRRPIDHEVSVDAGEYTGRGSVFLTEEDAAVIVTARHLIADAAEKGLKEFKVTFSDHTDAFAKILLIDEESDLCFLVIPREKGKTLPDSVAFSEEEKKELQAARLMPVIFDEDCPETTPERAMKFKRVNPPRKPEAIRA